MGRGGCRPIALIALSLALSVALAGACSVDQPTSATPAVAPATTAEQQHPLTTAAPPTAPTPTTGVAPAPALPAGDDTTVESVTDGDTIRVRGGVRVRLIGIDTPETVDPRTSVQCFGPEASARMKATLPPGTRVRLVYDVERLDRYGRTLAYVYRSSDGEFVNAAMVRDGYASAYTVPPNVDHADEFVALQREARDADRGLWGACPVDAPPSTQASLAPAPASTGSCDPSYPDVCIPPAPPDLDCGDITYRRFRVVGSDPHRFDADHDGVGCESG
jgi:micrococcal nuclease